MFTKLKNKLLGNKRWQLKRGLREQCVQTHEDIFKQLTCDESWTMTIQAADAGRSRTAVQMQMKRGNEVVKFCQTNDACDGLFPMQFLAAASMHMAKSIADEAIEEMGFTSNPLIDVASISLAAYTAMKAGADEAEARDEEDD
jgi:hypothetical protein